jgi:aryl-alcohol dehydrogenase-like predicted oxidoreductase
MRKKVLGDTDLELTVIGLGTWAIGGSGWAFAWGKQDDQESSRAILEGLEQGINWIDTAAIYGVGHSEEVVGKAVKEWSGKVHIATKCGLIASADRRGVKGVIKANSIIQECENSLRRLGVEAIDLYQIHWPNPPGDIEEGFSALLRLKEQGKIRWAGVSNFSTEQLEKVSTLGHVSSFQPPYSLLKRGVEKTTLDWCAKNKCGVIPYSPMQCGLLTGKVTPQWVAGLPQDDWRKTQLEFLRHDRLPQLIELVDELKEIAAATGHTAAQLAVAWVLRREEVTSAIVGARKLGQISEIVPAAGWLLSSAELEQIEAAYERYVQAK